MSPYSRTLRSATVAFGTALVTGVAAAPAAPQTVTATSASAASAALTVDKSWPRTCHAGPAVGRHGVAAQSMTAPADGWVTARLGSAGGSDWDLAIFEAASRRLVAASTGFGSREVAQGIVAGGARLMVQACRLSGGARTVALTIEFDPVDASTAAKPQLVRVAVPDRDRLRRLQSLGVDLTEHGGDRFREVVVYGDADVEKLRAAGFEFTTVVADLNAVSERDRATDRRYAAAAAESTLPSGRTTYRRLADYSMDMKTLAKEYPRLVRQLTLPYKTFEGRAVEGIEIAKNVRASDGRPVFLQMGLHHAREWPAGEHAMEWAFELVKGYTEGDRRATRLVTTTRTIVVPVVNPDGFNISREAGELQGSGDGDTIGSQPYEYRRKNCRAYDDSDTGNCLQPSVGYAEPGVDLNRNYGGFWGGAGTTDSSPDGRLSQVYRGKAPFSEPETQNIRALVSSRQVTALITNHTTGRLMLRPPGVATQSHGKSPDEVLLKNIGAVMANHNGYANIHGYQLYDTTGTTEDWTYWATGGLAYTYEIGAGAFHPPFQEVVDEWRGNTDAADAVNPNSGGNREAYYMIHRAAADPANHALIIGRAPAGMRLRLSKAFKTPTSVKDADRRTVTIDDVLTSELRVSRAGKFVWHVNPSTRPLVAPWVLKTFAAKATRSESFTATAPVPGTNTVAVENATYADHEFKIVKSDDRAGVKIRIEWSVDGNDYDLYVYKRRGDALIEQGASFTDNSQGPYEEVVLENATPGTYVARVVNWLAPSAPTVDGKISFHAPDNRLMDGTLESWALKCVNPKGRVVASHKVKVGRGERVDVGSVCARD